ncbi:MAG: hypothetical protein NT028_04225, partial [candidate division Zixibacteria bacterium]|nr:hypothetical protein [candidate division Zixibacteria bacterium]
ASGERKSRLLRRSSHPAPPLRTPRNDTVWAFSTAPERLTGSNCAQLIQEFAVSEPTPEKKFSSLTGAIDGQPQDNA